MPDLAALDLRIRSLEVLQAEKRLSAMEKKALQAELAAKKLGGTATRTAGGFRRMAASLGPVIGGLTGLLVFAKITKTIAGFEQTMLTVKGVTGATEEQFDQLSASARKMGATTRFSANEAAEGLLFLSRAGFSVNEATAALPATLALAQAGALGLGEAADHASNILRQFNIEAAETGRVADVLVNTANSANTNVLQLAEAMKFAGPIAGALGRELEETAAAIGTLGDSGIQATLAGTGLRQSMLALAGPTGNAKKALAGLGIALEDVDPTKRNLVEIFKQFAAANLDAATAAQIFGRRAAGAALILTANVGKLEELTEANKEAEGAAKKLQEIMDTGLTGAFFALKAALEEAALKIGDGGFGGALKATVQTMTGAVRILVGMGDQVDKFQTQAQLLANVIKVVGILLGVMIALKVVGFFLAAAKSVFGLTLAFKALALAIKTNPLGLIASAAIAAGLAFLSFSSDIKEVDKDLEQLNTKLATQRERFNSLSASMERAIKVGDLQRQISITSSQIDDLVKKADELTAIKNLKGPEAADLIDVRELELLGIAGEELTKLTKVIRRYKKEFDFGEIRPGAALLGGTKAAALGVEVIQAIELVEKRITTLKEQLSKLRETVIADAKATVTANDAKDTGKILAYIKAIEEETQVLVADADQQEVLRAVLEAQKFAKKENIILSEWEIKLIKSAIGHRQDLIEGLKNEKTHKDEVAGAGALMRGYIDELNQMELNDKEKEIRIALLALEANATKLTASELENYKKTLTDIIELVQKRREEEAKTSKETARANQLATDVGNSFANAFEDIVFGAKSAREAIAGLAREIAALVFRKLVTERIATGIANVIKGFAHGGDIRGPTLLFSPQTGELGIAGEAGPEVLMPKAQADSLKRGGGEAGGEQGPTTIIVNQKIVTPDHAGFKRSGRQTMRRLLQGIGK